MNNNSSQDMRKLLYKNFSLYFLPYENTFQNVSKGKEENGKEHEQAAHKRKITSGQMKNNKD
jgi:hypothetical protein